MTSSEHSQNQAPVSELTVVARDTSNGLLDFMEARSRAAGAAAVRNTGSPSMADQMAGYYEQNGSDEARHEGDVPQ